MYTFVNKNHLIPIVISNLTDKSAFNKLYQDTICRNEEYNNNVYLVYEKDDGLELFFSDGNNIYSKNDFNNNDKYTSIVNNLSKLNFMGNNFLLPYTNIKNILEVKKNQIKEMNLTIENKSHNNIILKENNKKVSFENNLCSKKIDINENFYLKTEIVSNPSDSTNNNIVENNLSGNNLSENNLSENNLSNKNNNTDKVTENSLGKIEENGVNRVEENEKKEQLITLIEQVNDLYQKELSNIKKLEMNLKVFDTKLNKLNKKKRENVINNLIKTQTEYQTWKKLKYKINDDIDILKPIEELELSGKTVPVLFLSKFDYINKIQENTGISSLFDEINLIDLNKLYTDNILPDDKIVQFCEKYVKLSKELHYHFDHDWDYLDNEMNLNSTNKLSN